MALKALIVGAGSGNSASFARIFFRNAINRGLAAIVCSEAVAAAQPGDWARIDCDDSILNASLSVGPGRDQ